MNRNAILIVVTLVSALIVAAVIFFNVTINQDQGIVRKLPPMPEEDKPPTEIIADMHNVLFIGINANDDILVKGEPIDIDSMRSEIKAFIDNNGKNPNYSASPQEAIISIKNDIGTSYNMYIQVQSEIAAAYRELRDAYSIKNYGVKYTDLQKAAEGDEKLMDQVREVKSAYPMRVSEAEPNISKE